MARPVGTKYIETPEKLWDLFTQYKNEVKKNPRKKMVFGGKDFSSDFELLERPLTLEGFENYCADLDIIQDLGHYFANTDNRYADYCTICSRIRKTIRQDQIEGGMVGQYNSSITQRLNGLVDKSQVDVKTEQPLFPES
jgi:hypothetical protein